jgi:sarcosine oxidase subunit alpha
MLASAVRDYVVNWAVSPGDRTVVVTNNDTPIAPRLP